MDHVLGLRCTICGAEYGMDQVDYVCPKHGDNGILDVIYDYRLLAQRINPGKLANDPTRSVWRYLPLLPVDPQVTRRLVEGTALASVGWTPLYPAPRLAASLGLRYLWIKDDGRQPTASFKDRASAIAVVKAREQGYEVVTTASTGNAAAALSGLCAAVAQSNVIFVPHTAPQAKIAQLLVFGARVLLVDGSYDDAFELCLKAAPEFGWYNRNTAYNPYMSEGKKTAAYEVCEQLSLVLRRTFRSMPKEPALRRTFRSMSKEPVLSLSKEPVLSLSKGWQAPDRIFVPVGDGCIIGGIHKGLRDMLALGWIDHMPKLMGVQAAGSAALVDAWERCLDGSTESPPETDERLVEIAMGMQPIEAHTVADSISAGLPRDRIKALQAVVESDGAFIRVSDEEIVAAIPTLAQGCGVFAEPAAAAAYAGLVKAVEQGWIGPDERVVVLVTGSGLKDVATAVKAVAQPSVVSPDLADVRRIMRRS